MTEYQKIRRLLRINIVIMLCIFVLVLYFGLTTGTDKVTIWNTRVG